MLSEKLKGMVWNSEEVGAKFEGEREKERNKC
jgi:hypothetical protein